MGVACLVGGLASAIGLSALIYPLTQANANGWTSVGLWVPLVAAAAGFTLFWLIERRATAPLRMAAGDIACGPACPSWAPSWPPSGPATWPAPAPPAPPSPTRLPTAC